MQLEALEIWRDIEKETGQELLQKGGLLYVKKPDHPDFKMYMKYGERLTADQINKRWPAFKVPQYLEGVFAHDAGVVRVKEALAAAKKLSIQQGAELKYDANVVAVDHKNGIVTMEDGKVYKAKNLVITCGAITDQFYQYKD